MKIAILLLCHESPDQIALRLSSPFYASADVKVYVHYDARRGAADLERLKALLPADLQFELLTQRETCAWGEFSLVAATHRLMAQALADTGFQPDYLALVSGSCMPIRPLASLQEFLRRRRGIDFIQAVDISQRSWVKDGLERERFQYYFPFNFQTQRHWFERFTAWQRRLGIERTAPPGLRMHFGSQWFCLTRETAAGVVRRLDEPELRAFFRRSWIPDEFAIQTLVADVQKPAFIAGHNLTYYEFDDQGRPLVLDNGHYAHLMRQPFFFARKVSPDALVLTREIHARVASQEHDLSYFNRAGHATNDYQRFLAHALRVRSARSHIGTAEDPWRGVMDFSHRPYFVLYAASSRYLEHLLSAARLGTRLPIFDFLFDPVRLVPASEAGSWRGIQSGMRSRRDYDPGAFLHEVVNIDAELNAAFAINPALPGWARSFVPWDPNATLVCCDPPDQNKAQLAEAALREMNGAHDGALMTATLDAVADQAAWLPLAHFAKALHEHQHTCRFLRLQEVSNGEKDATLLALKAAVSRVEAGRFYAPRDVAQTRLRNAHPDLT